MVYNANGSDDFIDYFWNPNPAGNNGIDADSTWQLSSGNYTLTINDESGCSRTFDFEIGEPDSLYFVEFDFDPAYCRMFGYQNGNGLVKGAAAGGTPDYSYLWKNLDTGEETDNTTWGGRNPGVYELTATDARGCIIKKTLQLDSLNPIASFTVTSAQLNSDLKGTAPVAVLLENQSNYFANPNNVLSDTVFFWNLSSPDDSWFIYTDYYEPIDTTYQPKGHSYTTEICLVATNKNGCTDTTCKIVTIFEPIVFEQINIFTPDEDGINDVFTFNHKAASIKTFECKIFNRWGETVAEINSISSS